jgi:hypothetical protein
MVDARCGKRHRFGIGEKNIPVLVHIFSSPESLCANSFLGA